MGATSAVVTFLTVFLFLIPVRLMNGEAAWPMMSGDMMFLHILNPILAAVEFIFFRWRRRIRVWECLVTMVPIFAYGSVYGFMVFITGEWDDFYGLTFGGDLRWGIASLGASMLMALLVSSVLSFAGKRSKRMRRRKRSEARTARGGRATGERLEHI